MNGNKVQLTVLWVERSSSFCSFPWTWTWTRWLPMKFQNSAGCVPWTTRSRCSFLCIPLFLRLPLHNSAAYVYGTVYPALQWSVMQQGISWKVILLVIVTIPSNFAMYTSLDWPATFYAGNLIWAVLGFASTGILFAGIWNIWKQSAIPFHWSKQVLRRGRDLNSWGAGHQ